MTAINGGADLYGTALSKGLCGRNHRVGGNKDHHQKGDKKRATSFYPSCGNGDFMRVDQAIRQQIIIQAGERKVGDGLAT